MPDPITPQPNTCFRQSLAADIGSPPAWTGCGPGSHEIPNNQDFCARNWGYAMREAFFQRCVATADVAHDMEACENQCAAAYPTDQAALAACLTGCADDANARLAAIDDAYTNSVSSAGIAYTACRVYGCIPD